MKDNVPTVRKAMRDRRCKVGTMDTWIVWVCEYDVFERRTYLEYANNYYALQQKETQMMNIHEPENSLKNGYRI